MKREKEEGGKGRGGGGECPSTSVDENSLFETEALENSSQSQQEIKHIWLPGVLGVLALLVVLRWLWVLGPASCTRVARLMGCWLWQGSQGCNHPCMTQQTVFTICTAGYSMKTNMEKSENSMHLEKHDPARNRPIADTLTVPSVTITCHSTTCLCPNGEASSLQVLTLTQTSVPS